MPTTETTDLMDELRDLRARLARLEHHRRPKHFNQKQAAEYLNRSEEWLRREHALGRGPKRSQRGRYWDYTLEDLDAYASGGDAECCCFTTSIKKTPATPSRAPGQIRLSSAMTCIRPDIARRNRPNRRASITFAFFNKCLLMGGEQC